MEKKSSETSKSIFRNVLYGFSTWILPLGLSFIATPIIVKSLGNDDYGIYALVLGFIGYSFNFNIGRAITKYIAEYRVKGEIDKINYIISTSLILNIGVGLFAATLIFLLSDWLVTDVYLIGKETQQKVINAFYLSAVILFITIINQVFNSILQGIHRFDIYSKIFNANSITILIGNIIIALSGFGLLALLLWNLIVLTIMGILIAYFTKKSLPEFKFVFQFNGKVLSLILKFSASTILYQLLSNFLLLFERGWITRKLGEESLTYYVVAMILGLHIHSFISSIMIVIFPLASELDQNREKLKKLYLTATRFVCFFVVFLATTLIIESKYFLTIWMGREFAENSWILMVIHSITFGLLAIQIVSWQLTEGLGYPIYNCLIFSLCLVINLSVMLNLTTDYGNTGIAIARLAGFGTMFISIFYIEKWFFKKVQIRFWLKIAILLTVSALATAFIERLILTHLSLNWFTLILATFLGGIVYCFVLYILGFITENEKKLIRQIISK